MDADAVEIRVLGCLIEKQRTTPDTYPLTLNALRLACNQATNRDPVVDYDEDTIREALQRLADRLLVVVDDGVAVGRLVAGEPQRVQGQWVGVGRRPLLLDQAAEHPDLDGVRVHAPNLTRCLAPSRRGRAH